MENLKDIEEYYSKLDDLRITNIAREDSKKLNEHVVEILIQEIKKRNLEESLVTWIRAENRTLTESEFADMLDKVRRSRCSVCQQSDHEIKGYAFTTLIGAIVTTFSHDYLYIICEKCGRQRRKESAITSLLLGWWSIKGLFSNPFVLIDKITSFKNQEELSENILRQFVLEKIGSITLANDSEEAIYKLIDQVNTLNEVLE